jgi:hypothetical protein
VRLESGEGGAAGKLKSCGGAIAIRQWRSGQFSGFGGGRRRSSSGTGGGGSGPVGSGSGGGGGVVRWAAGVQRDGLKSAVLGDYGGRVGDGRTGGGGNVSGQKSPATEGMGGTKMKAVGWLTRHRPFYIF